MWEGQVQCWCSLECSFGVLSPPSHTFPPLCGAVSPAEERRSWRSGLFKMGARDRRKEEQKFFVFLINLFIFGCVGSSLLRVGFL